MEFAKIAKKSTLIVLNVMKDNVSSMNVLKPNTGMDPLVPTVMLLVLNVLELLLLTAMSATLLNS